MFYSVIRNRWPNKRKIAIHRSKQKKSAFRNYQENIQESVKEFYRLNHVGQTVDFAKRKRAEFLPLARRRLGVWQALVHLTELVDDSDTDTDLP